MRNSSLLVLLLSILFQTLPQVAWAQVRCEGALITLGFHEDPREEATTWQQLYVLSDVHPQAKLWQKIRQRLTLNVAFQIPADSLPLWREIPLLSTLTDAGKADAIEYRKFLELKKKAMKDILEIMSNPSSYLCVFAAREVVNSLEVIESKVQFPDSLEAQVHVANFAKTTSALAESGIFKLLKNSKEIPISPRSLEIGKGYTVVWHNEKVILGDSYLGPTGTTTGSHKTLQQDANSLYGTLYNDSSDDGSLRFRSDGSVDVSGYHAQHRSRRAEDEIVFALKKACPGLKIQSTDGRLLELIP